MDARDERLVTNEIIFRNLNERIEEAAASHGDDDHVYEFLCECSNLACDLRLSLTRAEYERARSRSDQFVVAKGHDLPDIEEVIIRTDRYQLVAKEGEAARIAEAEDPRA
jgi:hypothetical protein